jgi:hypothetical protein
MSIISKNFSPNNPWFFSCEKCDFITSNKKDFSRHLQTKKHICNVSQCLSIEITPKNPHECACGKIYKDASGLWRHKKKCVETKSELLPQQNDLVILLLNQNMELIKQNQEFKDLLADQNKNMLELVGKVGGNTTNNNNTTNSNNTNNFNLQFFLNEQCKDALNIMDFVNTIKLQLSDLDMIGRVGYTEGMSKIFIRNLKELDIFKRPIHCSDLKRETLYVKDKDAWEKENGENIKIKKAIKGIENKNIKQLPQWRAENPTAEDTDTKKHLEYQHILCESMGGSTLEDDDKKHNKIVRNVAKEVVIDKTVEK